MTLSEKTHVPEGHRDQRREIAPSTGATNLSRRPTNQWQGSTKVQNYNPAPEEEEDQLEDTDPAVQMAEYPDVDEYYLQEMLGAHTDKTWVAAPWTDVLEHAGNPYWAPGGSRGRNDNSMKTIHEILLDLTASRGVVL